jgi:hypothetical protein
MIFKNTGVWDVTPSNMVGVNGRFGGTCSLHPQPYIMNTGEGRFSKTSVTMYQTTRYHSNLWSRRRENLKSRGK